MLKRKCGDKRNMQLIMYVLLLLSQTVMSKQNCLEWTECCVLEK